MGIEVHHRGIDVSFLDLKTIYLIPVTHVSDEGNAVLMTSGWKRVGVYNLRRSEMVSANQELFHGHLYGTGHVYQESLVSLAPKGVGDPAQPS